MIHEVQHTDGRFFFLSLSSHGWNIHSSRFSAGQFPLRLSNVPANPRKKKSPHWVLQIRARGKLEAWINRPGDKRLSIPRYVWDGMSAMLGNPRGLRLFEVQAPS